MVWVLTIKIRLIIGTIIAYGVAAATTMISVPTVAIEVNTDAQMQTVAAQTENTEVLGVAIANQNLTVEETVRSYFKDIPIMAEVARCESHFTHIDPISGQVTRGRVNPDDVGVMQINEYYHADTAANMGLELTNLEDNLTYARYLYEREGTQPWSASSACWGNNLLAMR